MKKQIIALTVVTTFAFQILWAAVIPGRWEKVEAQAPGTPLIVELVSGDRLRVDFESVDAEALSVTNDGGNRMRLAVGDVVEVLRPHDDSTVNGTLIGTGVGFGVGFGAGAAAAVNSGSRLEEEALSFTFLAGLIGAGVGAIAGWAIDRSESEKEVLYVAP